MATRTTLVYGLMAEFDNPDLLLNAARRAREAGYRRMDTFTPFEIEGIGEVLEPRRNWLPVLVFVGALVGAGLGYFMQWYARVIGYPYNIGGRPMHSWPLFVPVAFETAIILAAVAALVGMLVMNGLPQPYHPVFNAPRFDLASRDRFFLCIEARDSKFHPRRTRQFLHELGARVVSEVEC
jgi:hypothetical protein